MMERRMEKEDGILESWNSGRMESWRGTEKFNHSFPNIPLFQHSIVPYWEKEGVL
jgi:hypothetical protein